jgi:hypothetical protein
MATVRALVTEDGNMPVEIVFGIWVVLIVLILVALVGVLVYHERGR